MPRAPGKLASGGNGGVDPALAGFQKGNLTHQQRLAIVRKRDDEPRWTQSDLARWAKKQFGLVRQPTQSTISNILRARERLETLTTSLEAKSVRPVKHPELDTALLLWLRWQQCQSGAAPTPGEAVRHKARQLAEHFRYTDEMAYSNGWLRSYLGRHDIPFRKNQIDGRELVDLAGVHATMGDYTPRNIFTLAMTTLCYRVDPNRARQSGPGTGEPCLRVGLATNVDGSERLPPMIIGQHRDPPSFQGKSAFQWGFVDYYHNGCTQLTAVIFSTWLKRLNQRMAAAHRLVLLVVDRSSSFSSTRLSHVQVVVHADRELSTIRPLGVGLSTAFKAYYRKRQLTFAVDRLEAGESDPYAVSQLRAMRWIEQTWAEVPTALITEAWAAANLGLKPPTEPGDLDPAATTAQTLEAELQASITTLLEHLDVPGRIKAVDVITPRGEDASPHYLYDDTTIDKIVRESSVAAVDEAAAAAEGNEQGGQQARDFADASDLVALASGPPATAAEAGRQSLATKLEHFRGVLHCLDEECEPSEELTTTVLFLRTRQALLRAEAQRLARAEPMAVATAPGAAMLATTAADPMPSGTTNDMLPPAGASAVPVAATASAAASIAVDETTMTALL